MGESPVRVGPGTRGVPAPRSAGAGRRLRAAWEGRVGRQPPPPALVGRALAASPGRAAPLGATPRLSPCPALPTGGGGSRRRSGWVECGVAQRPALGAGSLVVSVHLETGLGGGSGTALRRAAVRCSYCAPGERSLPRRAKVCFGSGRPAPIRVGRGSLRSPPPRAPYRPARPGPAVLVHGAVRGLLRTARIREAAAQVLAAWAEGTRDPNCALCSVLVYCWCAKQIFVPFSV